MHLWRSTRGGAPGSIRRSAVVTGRTLGAPVGITTLAANRSAPPRATRPPSVPLGRRIRLWLGRPSAADLAALPDQELLDLAERLARAGRTRRAARVLAGFGDRSTFDARVLQRYGDLSLLIGAHESAVLSYLRASELHIHHGAVAKAAAILTQLVRLYPDLLEGRLALARVLESMGRGRDAAGHWMAAAQIYAALGDLGASQQAHARAIELSPRTSLPPILSQPPAGPAPVELPPAPPPRTSVTPPHAAAAKRALQRGDDSFDVDLGSLVLDAIDPGAAVGPGPTVQVSPIEVPARTEAHDTVFMPEAEALYAAHAVPATSLDLRPPVMDGERFGEEPATRMYSEADAAPTLLDLQAIPESDEHAALVVDLEAPRQQPRVGLPPPTGSRSGGRSW